MADADYNVKAIISAQTSQFEKGMKNAQSSVNSLSKSISNITNLVKKAFAFTGVVVGTKAVVDFGKSCVQSANQASKAFNILDNTVRATGADAWTSTEKLVETSKTLSNSTNYSVTEIQKMQSVLLGFTNITGEAFDGASEAVLDMATVMGMDLTSAVQTVGKALDDPITGLDSLRRQGFKFTDEQKEELAQLVRNGEQLKAQKIILDTLAISYGGASKAGQDSFAKQRHAIENFRDTLGGKLIPIVQIFAEKSSTAFNNLTEIISKMDFTPVINVVKNLNNVFTNTFENISSRLRSVKDEMTDFISRFNFKPIISVLDTLIGALSGVVSKIKEINAQKLDTFDKLKESLVDFSNSETFQNIVNFINKIIDAVFFLWSEVQDVINEIRNLVVDKIIEIWGKIKELFQNGQNALSQSGQDIASWGDLFYNVLNNAFRSFQDFFGMIKALIHGDWTAAWLYAKLTVMRTADSILNLISTIANAFPKLINGMIDLLNKLIGEVNKVRGWFGQDPLGLIEAFESVDLSKKSGLEDKIKEAEDKIQELTGKSADITIQNLEGVSSKFSGFTQHALGEIKNLTKGTKDETEKQKEYFSDSLTSTESEYKKFSEWDLKLLNQRLDGLKEYSKEYHEITLQIIEEERKKALEADKTGVEKDKINEYYNKEIEKENKRHTEAVMGEVGLVVEGVRNAFSKIASFVKNNFSKISNFIKNAFSKIASFVKETFSKIVSFSSSLVKSVTGLFEKLFEFNPDEFIQNLLEVEDSILTFFVQTLPNLPATFESAFESVIVLIDNLINSIDWSKMSEILSSLVNTFVNNVPKITSGILNLFSNLIKTLSTFFEKNSSVIVKSIGDMFTSVVQFLPGLFTNIERAIVAGVSSIGNYLTDKKETFADGFNELFSSLFTSLSNIAENLAKNIEPIKNIISETLTSLIENLSKNLPSILTSVWDIFSGISNGIVEGLNAGMPAIDDFEKKLPEVIKKIITDVSNNLGNFESVLDGITGVFETFIDSLSENEIFTNLGELFSKILTTIVNSISNIIPSMTKALDEIIPALGKFISDSIPSIIDLIVNVAIMIVKEAPKILQELIKMLPIIIKAIVESIPKLFLEGLPDLISGLITLIPDLINAGLQVTVELIRHLPEIIATFIKGLILGFAQVNWWEVIKSIFQAFIDGFKTLFGIHSPSTVFRDFGKNIWDGLAEGLKGIGEWFVNIFSKAWEGIKNAFSAVGDWASGVWTNIKNGFKNVGGWFKDTFEPAGSAIRNAFVNIGDWAASRWNDIKNGFKNVGDWFSSTFVNAKMSIKNAFYDIGSWASNIWNTIKNGFKNVGDWFKTTFQNAYFGIKKAFLGIGEWASGMWGNIKTGFSNVGDWFKTTFESARTKIKDAFSNLGTWASNRWEDIKNGFTNVKDWFKTTFQNARNGMENAFSNIKSWASTAWDNIKTGFSNVGNWFKTTFQNARSGMENAFSNVKSWAQSVGDKIKSGFQKVGDFFSNLWDKITGKDKDKEVKITYVATTDERDNLISGGGVGYYATASGVGATIKGYAKGTQNALKGLHLVGEAGPELVRFRGGEQVLNNRQTQKALSQAGTTINQNVTFNNLQDTTAFAMIQQLKQYNRQMAINGII